MSTEANPNPLQEGPLLFTAELGFQFEYVDAWGDLRLAYVWKQLSLDMRADEDRQKLIAMAPALIREMIESAMAVAEKGDDDG